MELQVIVFGIIYLISMLVLVFHLEEADVLPSSVIPTEADKEHTYG